MGLWYDETYNDRLRFGLRIERTLFAKQSDYQYVEIFESSELGRTLAIDGLLMTSEGDEHYYHEMIVHPAMVTVPRAKRVLVIGGGDGGTAREVLRHRDVQRVVMVEIDGCVIDACKAHLPTLGAWDDPRLEVIVGDGIAFVKQADVEPFDVIILDGSDPVGPSKGLFNAGFYEGVRRLLKPHGVFALQSGSPIIQRPIFLEVVQTLRRLFKTVAPYFGPVQLYAGGQWSWTLATNAVDPKAIREDRLTAIEAACKYYNGDIHRAAFALPNDLKRLLG